MIDFQAAERKRLEEPASEIGLEPLCAMVCVLLYMCFMQVIFHVWVLNSILLATCFFYENNKQINNNLRCYDLAMELSNSTMEALPQNYAEQVTYMITFICFCFNSSVFLIVKMITVLMETTCLSEVGKIGKKLKT
jgi:hypothetical protein